MKYAVADLKNRVKAVPLVLGPEVSTERVLVTGCTGWLGRHVVDELLQRGWSVVAPIRASNQIEAWARVPHWAQCARFEAVAVPHLEHTAGFPLVDAVIHIAADMSLANSLEDAWSSNVKSTQHLFQWARLSGCRRFDFVSTLSVFVASDANSGVLYEDQDLDSAGHLYGGYAASKWCAEKWLNLNRFGMNVGIHRLGLLSYSQRLGWAPTDGVAAWGRAWKQWGKPEWIAPCEQDLVDWTPTEYAARGIVESLERNSLGVHHWANTTPTPAEEWCGVFENLYGQNVGQWPRDELGKRAARALGRWARPNHHSKLWWHDIFQSDRHTYDQERAQKIGGRVQWNSTELYQAAQHL